MKTSKFAAIANTALLNKQQGINVTEEMAKKNVQSDPDWSVNVDKTPEETNQELIQNQDNTVGEKAKKKKNTLQKLIDSDLKPKTAEKMNVLIYAENHKILSKIAFAAGSSATLMSLTNKILKQFFEENKDEIIEMIQRNSASDLY